MFADAILHAHTSSSSSRKLLFISKCDNITCNWMSNFVCMASETNNHKTRKLKEYKYVFYNVEQVVENNIMHNTANTTRNDHFEAWIYNAHCNTCACAVSILAVPRFIHNNHTIHGSIWRIFRCVSHRCDAMPKTKKKTNILPLHVYSSVSRFAYICHHLICTRSAYTVHWTNQLVDVLRQYTHLNSRAGTHLLI